MSKLFTKKAPEQLKSVEWTLRVTRKEAEAIRHAAQVRQMPVTEYIRRTALGRKADVDYQTEIILSLRDVIAEMRVTCGVILSEGKDITHAQLIEILKPIVSNAVDAIKRISK